MEPSGAVTPARLVRRWVEAFNRGDSDALAAFYTEDAVNHQVAERPVVGRTAIRRMFAAEFASANMTCLIENIFEDREWAILEWRDPLGLEGCGFFRVVNGRIVFQRGYWDRLSFLCAQGKLSPALRELLPSEANAPKSPHVSPEPTESTVSSVPAESSASSVSFSSLLELGPYLDHLHRPQVIALWKSVLGYDTGHNKPALAIDRKLAVQDGLFFVATCRSLVVGTVLAGYDGHRGWLYSVAVDPVHRLSGIGRALVGHAEHALAKRGCMKINLQIRAGNEQVAGFYRSLGYLVEPRTSMSKRVGANIPAD